MKMSKYQNSKYPLFKRISNNLITYTIGGAMPRGRFTSDNLATNLLAHVGPLNWLSIQWKIKLKIWRNE